MNASTLPDGPEVVNVVNVPPAKERPNDAVLDTIESVPVIVKETKEGYKTTEFWGAIALSLAVTLEGVTVPAKYEGALVVVIGALYILSRGLAKKGVGVVEVKP